EGEQRLQSFDLLPHLGAFFGAALELHVLEEVLVARAGAVLLLERLHDRGVELGAGKVQASGLAQQGEARRPATLLDELVVQDLERVAGPPLVALPGHRPRRADVVLDVVRTVADALQPGFLDGGEVALGKLTLGLSCDGHESSKISKGSRANARIGRWPA